jgi:hypothetical protein
MITGYWYLKRKTLSVWRKISPNAILPSINFTIINLEWNLGPHSDRPATHVLSQDKDLSVEYFLEVTKETFINNKMGNLTAT